MRDDLVRVSLLYTLLHPTVPNLFRTTLHIYTERISTDRRITRLGIITAGWGENRSRFSIKPLIMSY